MKTDNELWVRVINDARFYDGSPQDLEKLIQHFKSIGITITEQGSINTSVVRPTSDSSEGGELLATEAETHGVSADYEKGYADGWEDAQRIGIAESYKHQGG